MAARKVRIFPDPVLREKCAAVQEFDDDVKRLVDDMFDTMYSAGGVGLAAPQVGDTRRVVVIDTENGTENERNPIILVNPEIVEKKGGLVWNEGCLSFPGIYEDIHRAERVVVKAVDAGGVPFTIEGEGLLAVALQHELDHLDGVLIFDYMSYIRKKIVKRELRKRLESEQGSMTEAGPEPA